MINKQLLNIGNKMYNVKQIRINKLE